MVGVLVRGVAGSYLCKTTGGCCRTCAEGPIRADNRRLGRRDGSRPYRHICTLCEPNLLPDMAEA